MSEKETLEKLLLYQQDLQTEERCLRQIIEKLNSQSHALQVRIINYTWISSSLWIYIFTQVEQLHILNAINKSTKPIESSTTTTDLNLKIEKVNPATQELDLSVPTYQSCEEDEDEMEDWTEQFLNIFIFIII